MDKDLSLKFAEDKAKKVEEISHQIRLAQYSSLIVVETSPSLAAVTHEDMSVTHGLREEPLVIITHEEHSKL